jgi:predicted amidohydrolase YtcJ
MTGILLRNVELGRAGQTDVRVRRSIISEIGYGLARHTGEDVLEGDGGALLPGLCDHHLHLHAMAAARASVRCGPPDVTGPGSLATALARAQADVEGWVRGIGYSENVAGLLDSAALDRLHSHRPVRIQHRSGALWIVNSAGSRALGLADAAAPCIERDSHGQPTGRLWRADGWLRQRLPASRPPDLHAVGGELVRFGITHVTDATPDLDGTAIDAITRSMNNGALPQHVQLLGTPQEWLGPTSPRTPTIGPQKLILADSGLPDLDSLADRIRAAHTADRSVAVHCVTREALLLLLAALAETGVRPGDRIEHAAMIPGETIPTLRDLGLTVVTQPGFLSWRGDDYLRDIPPADHQALYRGRSLLQGSVGCAIASDAPYGPLDPWSVMRAAVRRVTPSGQVAGPAERLAPRDAMAGYLTSPNDPGRAARRIAQGSSADLVLLRVPLTIALGELSSDLVAATLISGSAVWHRP